MLTNCLLLSISVSIDSLGIGLTYGLKKTKISHISNIILFLISFVVTTISIWFGNSIRLIFSNNFATFLGSIILIGMGGFILFQALNKKEKKPKNLIRNYQNNEKIFSFFIKFLGITIQIIKNPNYSDFDHSNNIDSKEALFLGLALSLDSFCIGIASSVIGIGSILFPIFTSIFQIGFLKFGSIIGKKISNTNNIPENIWSIISGLLLIGIGLIKILV